MKKILIIVAFLATSLFASMNWVGELEDAYDKAESGHKIVMVILTQKHCPACEYMENVVLKNDKVIKEFNKNFLAVKLDIHEDYVPLELKHFATPTIYFLDSDEKILKRINGYENEKDFIDELKKVKTKFQ